MGYMQDTMMLDETKCCQRIAGIQTGYIAEDKQKTCILGETKRGQQ